MSVREEKLGVILEDNGGIDVYRVVREEILEKVVYKLIFGMWEVS